MAVCFVRRFSTRVNISNSPLFLGLSQPAQVNLGKAKKLKDVSFECLLLPGWILVTLRTISRDQRARTDHADNTFFARLRRSEEVNHAAGESIHREWLELDCLLVKLCESQSIRVKVLLPEVVARGMVDLAGEYK